MLETKGTKVRKESEKKLEKRENKKFKMIMTSKKKESRKN